MKTAISFLLAFVLPLFLSAQQDSTDSIEKNMVTYYVPVVDSVPASESSVYADTIVMNDGSSVKCRITEVSPELIYFVVDTLPEATCVVTTSSVFSLKYSNGTFDLGANLLVPDYYEMGRADGTKYYRSREAFAGSFASGALCWFFGAGFISEIAIMATRPKKIHNDDNVNDHLLNENQDYYDGYMRSATNKKMLHSTGGFFAGMGTLVLFVVILVAYN